MIHAFVVRKNQCPVGFLAKGHVKVRFLQLFLAEPRRRRPATLRSISEVPGQRATDPLAFRTSWGAPVAPSEKVFGAGWRWFGGSSHTS